MEFFNSAIEVLQTLVVALGAGLGVWGAINLLEGYGNDNPGSKAHEGDPEAVDAVLSHYAGYIRYFSKMNGQVNAEVEDYVKERLIACLLKFQFDYPPDEP